MCTFADYKQLSPVVGDIQSNDGDIPVNVRGGPANSHLPKLTSVFGAPLMPIQTVSP
jgi:hypothetical protein